MKTSFYSKNKNIYLKSIFLGVLLTLTVSITFSIIGSLIGIKLGNAQEVNQTLLLNPIRIIIPLILSPLVEELIFRKWLVLFLANLTNMKQGIILSNLLFAFLHFDIIFIPYFLNGLIYSKYYVKTSKIYVSIMIHMTHNLMIFFLSMVIINWI